MSLNHILFRLLENMSLTGESQLITWNMIQQWSSETLKVLLDSGVLVKSAQASLIECQGCENRCLMDVCFHPGEGNHNRAFIVCDEPNMQPQMGRIPVDHEQLEQWKLTALQLAQIAARLLGIECNAEDSQVKDRICIGVIKNDSRHYLYLNKKPLELEVNALRIPLIDVLFFDKNKLTIDRNRIFTSIQQRKQPGSSSNKVVSSSKKLPVQNPEVGSPKWRADNAKHAANVRHSQSGGSRDKSQRIKALWATGNYPSRNACAEQECGNIGMSYSTARKALVGAPDPTPPL